MSYAEGIDFLYNFFLVAASLLVLLYTAVLVNLHTSPEGDRPAKRNSHLIKAHALTIFLAVPITLLKEKYDESQNDLSGFDHYNVESDIGKAPGSPDHGGRSPSGEKPIGEADISGSVPSAYFDAINGKWSFEQEHCPGARNPEVDNPGASWHEYEISGNDLVIKGYSGISTSQRFEKIVEQNADGLKSVSGGREYFYSLDNNHRLNIRTSDNRLVATMGRCK